MSESERARVGDTLDVVRVCLTEYVDDAMSAALGSDWNEAMALEDAQRRPGGRKPHIAKNDLAVMLKAIQYRKVAPWWNSSTYTDPRIRSYASEILTLRNLFAHGHDCLGEHGRLVDTASRFLGMLGIAVPEALMGDPERAGVIVVPASPESAPWEIVNTSFEEEFGRVDEEPAHMQALMSKAEGTNRASFLKSLRELETVPGSPEHELKQRELANGKDYPVPEQVGSEVFELLAELTRLDEKALLMGSEVLRAYALFVRCVLFDLPGGMGVVRQALGELARIMSEEDEGTRRATDLIDMLGRLSDLENGHNWRALNRLAGKLANQPLSNALTIVANMSLQSLPALSQDESLALVRDSIPRFRMFAAMHPGTEYETYLVSALRLEGRLCNDLGLTDDAVGAFARADEVIDRYPTADPDLRY